MHATPKKKHTGIAYEVIFALLAIVAVYIAMADLLGRINLERGTQYYSIDLFIQIIFTADYLIRFIAAANKKQFIKDNVPDLIAIIPFSSLFRAFRIVKLVRLVRLTKSLRVLRLLAFTMRFYKRFGRFFRTNGLIYALFFAAIMLSVSGILIAHFEGMRISDGLWWAFVTATTVGYGDLSPSTGIGRVIASLLMITGIGTIGMLTGTIATYFLSPKAPTETHSGHELEKAIMDSNELSTAEKELLINYMRYLIYNRNNHER